MIFDATHGSLLHVHKECGEDVVSEIALSDYWGQ